MQAAVDAGRAMDYCAGMTARTGPRTDPFVEHACELLSCVGPCVAKRMFGGWGISVDGMNIAVISRETLYLKGSGDTEAQWLAAGCRNFEYEAKGEVKKVCYFTAPDEAMESPALMLPWARLALEAAVAARARPAARKRKPTPKTAKPAKKPTTKLVTKTVAKKAPGMQAPQKAEKGKEKGAEKKKATRQRTA